MKLQRCNRNDAFSIIVCALHRDLWLQESTETGGIATLNHRLLALDLIGINTNVIDGNSLRFQSVTTP